MREEPTYLIILILFGIIASCGGPSIPGSTSSGSHNNIYLTVKGAKSFNPNVEHGQINSYRVTISGTGIDDPIIANFDGGATSGTIDNVPNGDGRKILVEAINPNGAIIREGEQENVRVKGNTEIEITLDSVPIFTNLSNNNSIDNTRLIFKVFSDPESHIIIEDVSDDNSAILADAATFESEISLDVSTGLGKMAPQLQPVGQHTYSVRNLDNNRSSLVTINVTDGAARKGASFLVASDTADPSLERGISCGTN